MPGLTDTVGGRTHSPANRELLGRWVSGLNQWIANPPYPLQGTEGSNPSLSAIRISQTVLPSRLQPDFCVVFEGYAGGAVHRLRRREARKRSLETYILRTC